MRGFASGDEVEELRLQLQNESGSFRTDTPDTGKYRELVRKLQYRAAMDGTKSKSCTDIQLTALQDRSGGEADTVRKSQIKKLTRAYQTRARKAEADAAKSFEPA